MTMDPNCDSSELDLNPVFVTISNQLSCVASSVFGVCGPDCGF